MIGASRQTLGSAFAQPEVDFGRPSFIGRAVLAELALSALATDLLLTGHRMAAEDAAQ